MFLGKELIYFQRSTFIFLSSLNFLQNQILLSSIPLNGSYKLMGGHLKCEQGPYLYLWGSSEHLRRRIQLIDNQQWMSEVL